MLPTKFQFSETEDCSLFKNIKGLVYNVLCYLRDRTLLNIKNKDYTIKKHENEMKLDLGLFKLDYKRSCDFVTLPGQDSCCLF